MVRRARILIAGGSGVFGRVLARELLERTSADLVVTGRDRRKLRAVCARLGAPDRVTPLSLRLDEAGALRGAAAGCAIVACTAGPFQKFSRGIVDEALEAGAHWLDIADTAEWVDGICSDEALSTRAASLGLAVMPGLSSVPAVSGALTDWCVARLPGVTSVNAALFIGNRNAKGTGAIASALAGGFSDPSQITFPFGSKEAYRFAVPSSAFGRSDVRGEFRVALEMAPAAWLIGMLAATELSGSRPVARILQVLSTPASAFGSDIGCVQTDVALPSGEGLGAACVGHGQSLAVLPVAIAIEDLLAGRALAGVQHPAGWIEAEELIARMCRTDVRFFRHVVSSGTGVL